MSEEFERYMKGWSDEDHREFEKLCFFRADEIAKPYTALMRAHEIENHAAAEEIVKRAYEASKDKIAHAYDNEDAPDFVTGAQIFADAIGVACAGPGRGPALTDAMDVKNFGVGQAHFMRESGFVMECFYGGYSGLIWDSFWFFEDPFGEDTSASWTTFALTEFGVEFCKWRYPERVEALRKLEESRKA